MNYKNRLQFEMEIICLREWEDLCQHTKSTYYVVPKFEFNKCSLEYCWNIKFKEGSKSLCTVYFREKCFCVMIVIGQKKKEEFERILPSLSVDIQKIYIESKEGNGQKFLMIDLEDNDRRYEDVKRIIITIFKRYDLIDKA